jgi:hypothetical protein
MGHSAQFCPTPVCDVTNPMKTIHLKKKLLTHQYQKKAWFLFVILKSLIMKLITIHYPRTKDLKLLTKLKLTFKDVCSIIKLYAVKCMEFYNKVCKV